jgi:hypothetical protein
MKKKQQNIKTNLDPPLSKKNCKALIITVGFNLTAKKREVSLR